MAVIINEFEVVAESASQERGGSGEDSQQSDGAAEGKGPTPHEIKRIIKHELERFARLWAH
jgi:hypothetical protein